MEASTAWFEGTKRQWIIDAVIAVAAFGISCLQLVLTSTDVISYGDPFYRYVNQVNIVPGVGAYLALLVLAAPLVVRRKVPWVVFGLTFGLYVLFSIVYRSYMISIVAPAVALMTIAETKDRRGMIIAACIAAAIAFIIPIPAQSRFLMLMMLILNLVLLAAAFAVGLALKTYRAYIEGERQRTEEAMRSREELAARRIADERVSIAREIHDITAHSLSAVTIQAAAAQRLIGVNDDAAREAVDDIRDISSKALDEIRAMIGVLRGDRDVEWEPTSGTDQLGYVVSHLEAAGLQVVLDERGYDKARVPAYADITLFAIARESATNIVRHAQAHHVNIILGSDAESAWLTVDDDGRGFDVSEVHADSHGLIGMDERVHALDGSFDVISAPGRGCHVVARIPIVPEPSIEGGGNGAVR